LRRIDGLDEVAQHWVSNGCVREADGAASGDAKPAAKTPPAKKVAPRK
jgi:hypothetical protein